MNQILENKLESLPQIPGVYKFLDREGNILYIGKALNLRSRVNSYFRNDIYDRPRIRQMMPKVVDLEITETDNEIEALVLESVLIKKHKPKYNSDLKDDKSYAWIYVSTKDEFPTVKIVRTLNNEEYKKGRLFGPYPSGLAIKRVFTYLRKLYPFCTSCNPKEQTPSLYFYLGLCPGPYHGYISKENYRKNINEIVKFLRGRKKGQINDMEREMKAYASSKDYEKAAALRDRISDLKYLGQNIEFSYLKEPSDYQSKRVISRSQSFDELEMELDIDNLKRIECYDISNIQGKYAYGSMVVSENGALIRSQYRIFKIQGKDTPDDPGMLKEVIQRRIKHIGKEEESFGSKPDIILIDGGKSQLGVLKNYIPNDIILMAISKGKHLKRAGFGKMDEFWIVRDGRVYRIDIENPALLIDLRDEAHRFAITHYRKRALKEGKRSKLENIEGVGDKRRKALLNEFKDIKAIKNAPVEKINEVIKNRKVSEKIKNYLLDRDI